LTEYSVKAELEFCAAFYFKKVDKVNFDYEVYAMRGKFASIDTNKPSIVDIISVADFFNYETWQKSVWMYPYITEFLARYQVDANMSDTTPFL